MISKKYYFIPSFSQIIFIIIFIGLLIKGEGLLGDGDTGYHIRAGEYIIENFTVPVVDIFSYHSPPLAWTAHEWLAEVIMAIIYNHLGLTGVVIFFSVLLVFTFYLFFRLLFQYNKNIVLILLIVLFALVCNSLHWLARPHAFTFLFLIIWYFILDGYQYRGKNHLYFLPVLMLFWVNLHGGYIIGFVLLAMYFLANIYDFYFYEEKKSENKNKIKLLFYVIVFCLGTTLINPVGYKILLFPFKLAGDKFLTSHVLEFLPTNFQKNYPFKYFYFFSLLVLLLSTKKLRLLEIVIFIVFSYMSFYSIRYTAIFSIIMTPILIKKIDMFCHNSDNSIIKYLNERSKNIAFAEKKAKGILYPIIIVVVSFILGYAGIINYNFDPEKKPVDAVKFLLKENISGNMFNNDEFGDYLIYTAYPKYRVFFDGRSDMYGEEIMKKYFKVTGIEYNWEKVIEEYKIGWIFFDANSLLSRYLYERPEWHLVYADKVAHIYVKNESDYEDLIRKYPDVKPIVYDKIEDQNVQLGG